MKKKFWKITAMIIAICLIIGVCWFANALNGNPVSKMLAQRTAEEHLEENYPGTDYYIERLGFSFKDTCYYAHIRSETSIDTQFTLYIDMLGKLYHDTYGDVLSGAITAGRIETEYRELTDQIFESPTFPYAADIAYGTLEIYPRELINNPEIQDIPRYCLIQDDLVLDRIYDSRELGAQAGHLVVYVYSDTLTVEAAAEVLLGIRAEFDEANIPFRAIDFTLRHPKNEDGPWDEEYIGVENFPYDEIYIEGMSDRVKAADEALKAYRAELDAKE